MFKIFALCTQIGWIHYDQLRRIVLVSPHSDLPGSPAEDSPPPTSAAPAAEAGSLLPVQRRGADPAHVRVRSARPLDGLRLVRHWAPGDRKQRPHYLGNW